MVCQHRGSDNATLCTVVNPVARSVHIAVPGRIVHDSYAGPDVRQPKRMRVAKPEGIHLARDQSRIVPSSC